MGKVGGNRNYGYGKKLAWAGRNALARILHKEVGKSSCISI